MTDRNAAITLGHGSGGRLTHELVRDVFGRRFANRFLEPFGDSAVLDPVSGRIAMTTDSFVVSPIFFSGGDIGTLAVNGTVNDLAVAGAVPMFLSAAFILEEGLARQDLEKIAASMAGAAAAAAVAIVTGDTKVVERGHGDSVFITTAGVGKMREGAPSGISAVQPGDRIVVSGPVGDHGAVIAAQRSGIEGTLVSDCAPVVSLVEAMYRAGVRPKFMRDPTRGGLATVLAELAHDAGVTAEIMEQDLPVRPSVLRVCDILGLDALYLACEGRVVAVVPAAQADPAVQAMQSQSEGRQAAVIGEIRQQQVSPVVLRTRYGGSRAYDTLASEQLPRIC